MSDWKTYPQEVPEVGRKLTAYSFDRQQYLHGEYSKKGGVNVFGFLQRLQAGDLWKYGDTLPPPHSPESAETTPLVEAAAATATSGDKITPDKLRAEEGLELYSSNMKYETYETEHLNDSLSVRINLNTGNVIAFDNDRDITITTMSELRTLVRWLS